MSDFAAWRDVITRSVLIGAMGESLPIFTFVPNEREGTVGKVAGRRRIVAKRWLIRLDRWADDSVTSRVSNGCSKQEGSNVVKLTVRDRESIQEAVRRFRKLVERSGIKKEMRRREYFEKPSEIKRRARLRAERRNKRNRLMAGIR